MKEYKVYGLKDPISNNIKYIGLSTNVNVRYRQHLYKANKGCEKKDEWIKYLKSLHYYPEIVILDQIKTENKKEALNLQTKYIIQYRNTLFNIKQRENNGMKKTVSFKIDDQLLDMFNIAVESSGKTNSEMVEDFMRKYVDDHKDEIKKFIKDYWYE